MELYYEKLRNSLIYRDRARAGLRDTIGVLSAIFARVGVEAIPGLLVLIRKATSEQLEYGKGKKMVSALEVKARRKASA